MIIYVELDPTQYINLNTASSVPVGSSVEIQNHSTQIISLAISETQPLVDTLTFVSIPPNFKTAKVVGELTPIWVKGVGSLRVQEF